MVRSGVLIKMPYRGAASAAAELAQPDHAGVSRDVGGLFGFRVYYDELRYSEAP
jgi:hypothetical protein